MRLEGWHLIIIIVLALVLFAAPKLPGMARSLGQSMRIFKSEVREMKKDGNTGSANDGSDPVEGRVVNHPQATSTGEPTGDGTDVPPSEPRLTHSGSDHGPQGQPRGPDGAPGPPERAAGTGSSSLRSASCSATVGGFIVYQPMLAALIKPIRDLNEHEGRQATLEL